MKTWIACAVAAGVGLGCESKPTEPPHRAELHKLSGNVVEIVPTENQPEWCVAFSIADKSKIIRQLTMNRNNRSFTCPAGKPIGNVTFRIPVDEGSVKIYVFFSDQRLNSGSIAQQLYDLSARPNFNVLDLRAPGRLVSEKFDFTPEEAPAPAEGGLVGAGGALEDAGNAPAPADAGAAAGPAPAADAGAK